MRMLSVLWRFRHFVLSSVKREFQAKYMNSLLGGVWAVINPMAMITVYTLIFSQLMNARLPGQSSSPYSYGIYLCAGLLLWNLFSEIAGRNTQVFIEQANLIKKMNFPKICLPVIVSLTALLNFAIVFGLFLLFLAMTGSLPGWALLGMLPVLLTLVLFSTGLGISLGVLNVFFRDVGHFFSVVLQFWFWLTPVVYAVGIVPEEFRYLIELNPLLPVVSASQSIFVSNTMQPIEHLAVPFLLGCAFCLFGLVQFKKRAGEMVDEL